MAADEYSLLSTMTDSFYSTKRARLEAELAARLAELEEFEARERALALTTAAPGAPAANDAAGLLAALEEERERSAALQAQLLQAKMDQEIAVQKVSAFWVAKLAEAKETPAAIAAAAPPTAASSPAPDIVPDDQVLEAPLDPNLSLRELRARLLSYDMSTTGTKMELRARLGAAMMNNRQQYKSWDPEKRAWS